MQKDDIKAKIGKFDNVFQHSQDFFKRCSIKILTYLNTYTFLFYPPKFAYTFCGNSGPLFVCSKPYAPFHFFLIIYLDFVQMILWPFLPLALANIINFKRKVKKILLVCNFRITVSRCKTLFKPFPGKLKSLSGHPKKKTNRVGWAV